VRLPHWKYSASRYEGNNHHLVYRDDHLGVELQIVTSRSRSFLKRGERRYYRIDDVETTFRTEEAMLRMLERVWERESRGRHSLIVHLAHSSYSYEDKPKTLLSRLSHRLRHHREDISE
jgi:hypothetical protein